VGNYFEGDIVLTSTMDNIHIIISNEVQIWVSENSFFFLFQNLESFLPNKNNQSYGVSFIGSNMATSDSNSIYGKIINNSSLVI